MPFSSFLDTATCIAAFDIESLGSWLSQCRTRRASDTRTNAFLKEFIFIPQKEEEDEVKNNKNNVKTYTQINHPKRYEV